ncbi:hypothetical protein RJ639_038487 [Escallonia herrerae]|uniref:Uncharacterized protein n=1 Tax=Escallonia herrerae TaxID=1293975 RepID=A0AA88WR05_9ASTE|nr:hypothetical protein RJ639_038487 [Escallonia herrerae]
MESYEPLIDSSSVVPCLKYIQRNKMAYHQALQLVKCLCKELKSSNDHRTYTLHSKRSVLLAARLGLHEVVEDIVDAFPHAIWSCNEYGHCIFQLAVIHRCEKVINLIYQMSGHKYSLLVHTDTLGNNVLHLAGGLAPPRILNLVVGAALQMQRELQWFKEVEKLVNPSYKVELNCSRETPSIIFI